MFGSYEPLVKVETSEVKMEEKKEAPKGLKWEELSSEEQERVLQYFLEIEDSGLNLKERLCNGYSSQIAVGIRTWFNFDNNKYISLRWVLPHILKHLNIKESWIISVFVDRKNDTYLWIAPVIAPAP